MLMDNDHALSFSFPDHGYQAILETFLLVFTVNQCLKLERDKTKIIFSKVKLQKQVLHTCVTIFLYLWQSQMYHKEVCCYEVI